MENVFRPAARIIVLNEKNEVLIVKVKKVWALPWGWIDFWENMIDALERESLEELWIKAEIKDLISVQDKVAVRKWKNTHYLLYFWTIKNNEDFKNVLETSKTASHSHELSGMKWCDVDNLPEEFVPKKLPWVLKDYVKNKENFKCVYESSI